MATPSPWWAGRLGTKPRTFRRCALEVAGSWSRWSRNSKKNETMDELSCIRTSSELSQLNLLQVSDLLVILVLNLLHYNSQLERAAIAQGPLPVLRRLLLQLAEREPRLCPGLKLKSIQYTWHRKKSEAFSIILPKNSAGNVTSIYFYTFRLQSAQVKSRTLQPFFCRCWRVSTVTLPWNRWSSTSPAPCPNWSTSGQHSPQGWRLCKDQIVPDPKRFAMFPTKRGEFVVFTFLMTSHLRAVVFHAPTVVVFIGNY